MLQRTFWVSGLTLVLLANATQAQERPRGFGQGQFAGFLPGGAGLLAMPEVQKELSISDEQKGLIDDMLADLREQQRNQFSGFQGFQDMSDEERRKALEDMRKRGEETTKKADEMTNMILEPKQVDRLSQLRIQREGAAALMRPDVADKLKLTQSQRDKIRSIQEEVMPRFGAGGGGGGATFNFRNFQNMSDEEKAKMREEGEKMRERIEKSRTDMVAVLTPEQKDSFEKMQGKKFDFPAPAGFGGRGERRKEEIKK